MNINLTAAPAESNCNYVLFPGCKLCEYEPSIVVKLYDSLRFQNPDTGIMIHCCRDEDFDLKSVWKKLGKPKIITTCPGCLYRLRGRYPEIEFKSVYELLVELGIGGGCNSIDYNIVDPAGEFYDEKSAEAVRTLAEDMGVTLQHSTDYPNITQSISSRNALIESGENAAHILELIYGMGELNSHLVHEHHDHENHDDTPQEAPAKPSGVSFPDENKLRANRQELVDILIQLYQFPCIF